MNTNCVIRDCPSLATCVGIFRESRDKHVDDFLVFFRVQTFIYVKFMKVIYALQQSCGKGQGVSWFFGLMSDFLEL